MRTSNANSDNSAPGQAQIMVAAGLIVLVGLLAMGAWFSNGNQILWSLVQSGLAWCL